ncbi:MAG: TonB family protein [Bacteroidales bacterium]|nr:TonB family protein [Bacteroidales bacterium]
MMLNKKSSRMSAWKALYVIPLVGISLAATAETKVDYQYEDPQPVAAADTLKSKDSENWYKLEHNDTISTSKKPFPEPKSEFTKKNLREGRFLVDKENNTVTLIYFNSDCKELQVKYTGLDLNQNIYMHNGAIVTKEMQDKATYDDPDVVIIVAYLKDNNRVSAAITKTGPYVTGTINMNKKEEEFTLKSSIHFRTADGKEGDVNENDLVFVVNGERMLEGFDLNTIDPSTIASMEVLKTEKALQEYGTDKGVIVITTDPSKANEKKPAYDIYIDGKKATSEEVAALPANPKGYVEPDGTVQLITEEKAAEKKEPVPFQHLGQQPTFNGGNANEFSKWVAANMKYPEKCRQSKVQGRVTLQFIISATGEVTDVKVLRGVNEDLDKEALRVVSASPRWTPGKDKNGNIVPVIFTFPVLFQL